jgi:phthiodiolone/phenolphthiodiolone dimycocerosates ketoreductase
MGSVETGACIWGSRYAPPRVATEMARTIEQSGVVDQLNVWDQLMNWFPQPIWTSETTPLAEVVADVDSIADPVVTLTFGLAGLSGRLGFGLGTDLLRRNPAELAQTLLTLASATEGRGSLYLGAGEAKNAIPFGVKRSLGVKRLEDGLQVLCKLLKEERPVNHEGTVWAMKDAFVGNAGKERRPEIVAMGGGPRLIDAALRYADGIATGVPFVAPYPEEYGEMVRGYKASLAELGRGDDPFSFTLIHMLFLCKDADEFDKYVDNPLLKFFAATAGRLNMNDWDREGIEPVMPRDWHYAFKMLPGSMTKAEILDITDRVTPEMVRKTFHYGAPADIAAKIRPFSEHGGDRHLLADMSSLLMAKDPLEPVEGMIEVCRLVKAPQAAAVAAGSARLT